MILAGHDRAESVSPRRPRCRIGVRFERTLHPLAAFRVLALLLALPWSASAPGRLAPAHFLTQRETEAVFEGTLEVLIEDADHSSRTLYFLISGDQRISLQFQRPPLDITTGARVRVRGRWDENHALVVTALERI